MKKFLSVLLFGVSLYGAACPTVASVTTQIRGSQTFVMWPDVATGAAGTDYQYITRRDGVQFGTSLSNSAQFVLQGRSNFTPAKRYDATKAMWIIQDGGSQLPLWTGLTAWTATTNATGVVYSISVIHRTNACTESAQVAAAPVDETAGITHLPILQIPYTAASQNPSQTGIDGTLQPAWFNLHASGAGYLSRGDLWGYFMDLLSSSTGPMPSALDVWQDKLGGTNKPNNTYQINPQDARWLKTGLGSLEGWWLGYYDTPLNKVTAYGERILNKWLTWALAHYNIDQNRVYSYGKSMGAWGSASWAIHRPDVFAAHFLHLPRWTERNTASVWYVPSLPAAGNITAGSLVYDDGVAYTVRNNQTAFLTDCANPSRFIAWAIGKNDEYSLWSDQVATVAAMRGCSRPFAFYWDNNNHSGNNTMAPLLTQYQAKYAKNLSHPSFNNSSLDANPNTDLTGCINCGWIWSAVTETSTDWTVTVSNTNNTAGMTVDITTWNMQTYAPVGTTTWTSSTGQSGTAVVAYGKATATGLTIPAGTSVTLTFTSTLQGARRNDRTQYASSRRGRLSRRP